MVTVNVIPDSLPEKTCLQRARLHVQKVGVLASSELGSMGKQPLKTARSSVSPAGPDESLR